MSKVNQNGKIPGFIAALPRTLQMEMVRFVQANLSSEAQEVIRLKFYESMSLQCIAKHMGKSFDEVFDIYNQALKSMRTELLELRERPRTVQALGSSYEPAG